VVACRSIYKKSLKVEIDVSTTLKYSLPNSKLIMMELLEEVGG
jgi:hypothetical protein